MSKMKSKFRPTSKSSSKPSAPRVWCVDVKEFEEGWGIRTDDRLEFPSEEEANAYATKFNKESATHDTDENFYQAVAYPKDPAKNKS